MPDAPDLAALADRCVKCGLCLPHCPSYGRLKHEADSPRGRIALVQGLISGRLSPDASVARHLDACLGCRACEPVCPAEVPYLTLLDEGRRRLLPRRPWRARLGLALLTRSAFWRLIGGLARLWAALRPRRWAAPLYRLGRAGRALSLLPDAPAPGRPAALAPLTQGVRGEVDLLIGCAGSAFERPVAEATGRALAALGFAVRSVPGCCGALASHAGAVSRGQAQAEALSARRRPHNPLVGLASGCVAQLQEGPGPAAVEALRFIRQHWPAGQRLQPLAARVAVHRPCTQRHGLRSDGDLDWLLGLIPGLTPVALNATGCCGAAGHHLLAHPGVADAHLAPLLAAVQRAQPDLVVSANLGCRLHLAGGLRRAGTTGIAVIHPLELLVRQWPAAAGSTLPPAAAG